MEIKKILLKFIAGILDSHEEDVLEQWRNQHPSHEAYFQKLSSRNNYSELYAQYLKRESVRRRMIIRKCCMRVAACLIPLILISGMAYFFYGQEQKSIIVPGSSRAELYLENGSLLVLQDEKESAWICVNDNQLVENKKGSLHYDRAKEESNDNVVRQNKLKTPRGGEYKVVLPDGTMVRLNANSTLTYPTRFTDDRRVVELEGEAYFEISKDSLRSFIVKANGLEIRQYGTKFSVNARSPQATTVALEEGSIGVYPEGKEELRMITPGEIVRWCRPKNELVVHSSQKELRALTAWHHDRFVFENEPLSKVMEHISLWYDVEVRFQNAEIATMRFSGNIGRYADIKVLLEAVETTGGICVKVENKQITLMSETIIN